MMILEERAGICLSLVLELGVQRAIIGGLYHFKLDRDWISYSEPGGLEASILEGQLYETSVSF